MFATLHAGIGVKKTHSYARSLLFYQHQYPAFGGIETVTTLLAKAFAEDGHEIRIVSFICKPGTDLLAQLPSSVRWQQLPESALDSAANRADWLCS